MSAPPGRNGRGQYNVRLEKPGAKKKHDAPGVTSISGMLEKGGLVWAAARETATRAVLEPSTWQHLPPAEAIESLRKHFRFLWDVKADTGTIVHEIALAWSYGLEVDLNDLLDTDTKTKKPRGWSEDVRREVIRRVDGCLLALDAFYRKHHPEWIQVEQTVVHLGEGIDDPDAEPCPSTCYAGTFDARASLRGVSSDIRLDWKTGGRYPTETTIQMAGYDFAKWLGRYEPDGTLKALEPHTRAEKSAVVYLNDTGDFELLELPVDSAAFETFMGLRRAKRFVADMAKWEKAHPAPEPDLEALLTDSVPPAITTQETAA